jgi:V8-like Glu-specific endopeptidase
MYEVTTRTTYPYSAICYVVCTWGDGTSTRGSGTVVGPNDVLTALHVVYNERKPGGWATSISITPAADTSPFNAPYGTFTNWGRVSGRTINWDTNNDQLLSDAESQYDLALIGMRSRIGDITGWLTPERLSADFYGVMAGYPARGTGLMAEDVFADASFVYGVYDINYSGLGAGASGGPLLHTSGGQTYVVGALSSGNTSNTSSTYAGLHGSGTWDWLNTAMSANDDLIANQLPVSINGTPANDTLAGNALNNVIAGGAGLDTVSFSGARGQYNITVNGGTVVVSDLVSGRDGIDTLTNVERLRFVDKSVALDLSASAGVVAKVIGAVFGASSLVSLPSVGLGLKLMDSGMLYSDLMQYALNARLGTGASDALVVNLLYTNVMGVAPGAAELTYFTGLLRTGQYTQATLGVLAAETPSNVANINLTGLASTGLEYVPQA